MSSSTPKKGWTLTSLELSPETACATCPHSLWHVTAGSEHLRVYCRMMFVLVDELLMVCDGNPPAPPEPETPENTDEATASTPEGSSEATSDQAEGSLESSDESETSNEALDPDDIPDPSEGPDYLADLDEEFLATFSSDPDQVEVPEPKPHIPGLPLDEDE